MGRPRKDDREATRSRLLAAAELQFGAHGFVATRLEDIAALAGVRRSSLLYHFESKAALWTEVVDRLSAQITSEIEEAIAQPSDVSTRIDGVIDTLVTMATARKGAVSMFVRELLDGVPHSAAHMPKVISMIDLIEGFLRAEASHLFPPGAPIRSGIVHLLTAGALRAAAGDFAQEIWGPDDNPRTLIRALLKPGETKHAL